MYDVIIVGGGASGMMAAAVAGESGKRVLLIEKNKNLGEKLKISGGGRCNITNAEYDVHKFLSHYGKAAPFLYSPYSQFGVKDTFRFLNLTVCHLLFKLVIVHSLILNGHSMCISRSKNTQEE